MCKYEPMADPYNREQMLRDKVREQARRMDRLREISRQMDRLREISTQLTAELNRYMDSDVVITGGNDREIERLMEEWEGLLREVISI